MTCSQDRSGNPEPEEVTSSESSALPQAGSASSHSIRAAFEFDWEPFVILDQEGVVRHANARMQALLPGASTETVFIDCVVPEDRPTVEQCLSSWRTGPDSMSWETFVARLVGRSEQRLSPRVQWHPMPVFFEAAGGSALGLWGRDVEREHRYQAALEESELRQRSLLRGVLNPLVIIDAYGVIQSASDSMEQVFGYRPEELVGRNVNVLMPEPHHSAHDNYLANYRSTGKTNILGLTRPFEVLRKDGVIIHCELSVSRVDIPGRPDPLFTGSLSDITEQVHSRNALRKSEQRLRAIFDQEFQMVGLLDCSGVLLDVNRAALEVSGLERADVVGKPFEDTSWWSHSEGARKSIIDAVKRAANGEFVRFETRLRTETNGVRELDFSIKAVEGDSGAVELMICEARDITELKQVTDRQDRLSRALAEIGQSAAMLAHEMKTPVTAVNLALRAVADKLGQDDRVILDDLVVRMQRLNLMMRQTQSFAKSHEPVNDRCHSIAVMDDAIAAADLQIHEHGADVQIDSASEIVNFQGDKSLLREVFVNLIENAVTVADVGAKVRLSSMRGRGNHVVFGVYDDGPGIEAGVRKTLFKAFVTTRSSGTGLGLAICKRIVDALGGSIDVVESPLGGAGFELMLPME
ncbi:MAG: two-component system sensor histidine kinase/response regulator [Planctomycetota bacterium]|jgi:two-component system sensor histidine kinase/response regulator